MKGLWVDRIVDALRDGEVDLAVHSAKDLPAEDRGRRDRRRPRARGPAGRPDRSRGAARAGHGRGHLERPPSRAAPGRVPRDGRDRDPRQRRHAPRKLAEGEVDGLVLAAAGLARLGGPAARSPAPRRRDGPGAGAGSAGDPRPRGGSPTAPSSRCSTTSPPAVRGGRTGALVQLLGGGATCRSGRSPRRRATGSDGRSSRHPTAQDRALSSRAPTQMSRRPPWRCGAPRRGPDPVELEG